MNEREYKLLLLFLPCDKKLSLSVFALQPTKDLTEKRMTGELEGMHKSDKLVFSFLINISLTVRSNCVPFVIENVEIHLLPKRVLQIYAKLALN